MYGRYWHRLLRLSMMRPIHTTSIATGPHPNFSKAPLETVPTALAAHILSMRPTRIQNCQKGAICPRALWTLVAAGTQTMPGDTSADCTLPNNCATKLKDFCWRRQRERGSDECTCWMLHFRRLCNLQATHPSPKAVGFSDTCIKTQ